MERGRTPNLLPKIVKFCQNNLTQGILPTTVQINSKYCPEKAYLINFHSYTTTQTISFKMNYQNFSNNWHPQFRQIKISQNKIFYCNMPALYLWRSYYETTSLTLTRVMGHIQHRKRLKYKPEGVTFSYNTLLKRKTKRDEFSLGCCSKGEFSLTAGPPLPPADSGFNCNT